MYLAFLILHTYASSVLFALLSSLYHDSFDDSWLWATRVFLRGEEYSQGW
jgi:hypothetical protein